MGMRRVRSNTGNEPPHETEMALVRMSDLGMGSCVWSLDDVHGHLDHEWHASSSLQGPCALILGQPPSGGVVRPPTLTMELETLVRALRDAEILAMGSISAVYIRNRFEAYQ